MEMHGWFDSMWHGWWWGGALLVLAVVIPVAVRSMRTRRDGDR